MIPGDLVGLYLPKQSEYQAMVDLRNDNADRFFTPGHITLDVHLSFMQRVNSDMAQVMFVIKRLDTGALVGTVGLYDIDYHHRRAEYGRFVIDEAQRGQGFGTEALRLILRYGFERLKLRRIHGEVLADNTAALHVCRKLGFQIEGTFTNYVKMGNSWHDVCRVVRFR
jgi:RimJ/RimL family protein N-acetyltransferase